MMMILANNTDDGLGKQNKIRRNSYLSHTDLCGAVEKFMS
jgi:hypothetical protein